ncbi:MAG TPA: RDD family protein [Verrucomicrobiae bacterium]|nr:RDD family protein [Verrucomicrobiae bacterium]
MRLDTQIRIETPEGVDLRVSPAGPIARAQAWLIDAFIKWALFVAAVLLLMPLGQAGGGVASIVFFGIAWAYPVIFEVLGNGATPGKRALRLRVVHDNGTPISWSASMIRNLLRAADFLPFAYGFGLASCLLRRDFKRLGDIAAGTLVVHTDAPPAEARAAGVPPVPLPFALTVAEQRALVDFAERVPTLTRERADELARLLRPLAPASRDRVADLAGMAAWIVGRR